MWTHYFVRNERAADPDQWDSGNKQKLLVPSDADGAPGLLTEMHPLLSHRHGWN
jgi:hypothetical protein